MIYNVKLYQFKYQNEIELPYCRAFLELCVCHVSAASEKALLLNKVLLLPCQEQAVYSLLQA